MREPNPIWIYRAYAFVDNSSLDRVRLMLVFEVEHQVLEIVLSQSRGSIETNWYILMSIFQGRL